MNTDINILTGKHSLDSSYFTLVEDKYLETKTATAYNKLKKRLEKEGISLRIFSGVRLFEAQLTIWNAKASGIRPVLDDHEKEIDISSLSPKERIFSILRWSALPGFSRHHWGTDLDVYDENSLNENYKIQLVDSEYENQGIFNKLTKSLDKKIEESDCEGFFRPYQKDLGGIGKELWHLSYHPISSKYLTQLNFECFLKTLNSFDDSFLLLDEVKDNAKEIYERFIVNISSY